MMEIFTLTDTAAFATFHCPIKCVTYFMNTPVSQTHARSEICVGTGLPRRSSHGVSCKANFAWGLCGDCVGTVPFKPGLRGADML